MFSRKVTVLHCHSKAERAATLTLFKRYRMACNIYATVVQGLDIQNTKYQSCPKPEESAGP